MVGRVDVGEVVLLDDADVVIGVMVVGVTEELLLLDVELLLVVMELLLLVDVLLMLELAVELVVESMLEELVVVFRIGVMVDELFVVFSEIVGKTIAVVVVMDEVVLLDRMEVVFAMANVVVGVALIEEFVNNGAEVVVVEFIIVLVVEFIIEAMTLVMLKAAVVLLMLVEVVLLAVDVVVLGYSMVTVVVLLLPVPVPVCAFAAATHNCRRDQFKSFPHH